MKRHFIALLLLLLAGTFAAMSFSFARHARALGLLGGGGTSDIDNVIGIIPKLFGAGVVVFALLTAAASLYFIYIAIRFWLAAR